MRLEAHRLDRHLKRTRSCHRAGDGCSTRHRAVRRAGRKIRRGGFHRQLVAADFADLNCRNAHEFGAFDHFHGVEGLQVMTMRDCVSPKSRASRRRGDGRHDRRFAVRMPSTVQINLRADQPRRFAGDELADAAFRQRRPPGRLRCNHARFSPGRFESSPAASCATSSPFPNRSAAACRSSCRESTCKYAEPPRPRSGSACVHDFAEQNDRVAFVLEPLRGDVLRFFDQADHGDRRRGVNRAVRVLVVEATLPPVTGALKARQASARPRTDSCNCQNISGLIGLPIEIVGRAQRHRAGTGEIAAGLRHDDFPAFVRIEINVSAVAIHRQGDEFFAAGRACDAMRRESASGSESALMRNHRRVAAGANHRAVAHHVVVLAINPVLGRDASATRAAFSNRRRRPWCRQCRRARNARTCLQILRLAELRADKPALRRRFSWPECRRRFCRCVFTTIRPCP